MAWAAVVTVVLGAACMARAAPANLPPTVEPAAVASDGSVIGLDGFFCPKPEERPRKPVDQFGYGISSNWSVGDIGYWNNVIAHKLRLDWVGVKINWQEFEPERLHPNLTRWQLLDSFMADANWRGLNVLFTVTHPPQWSRVQPNPTGQLPSPPDDAAEAARFLGTLAARYKGCLHAIEVFNEVNLGRDWQVSSGQIRAEDYRRVLSSVAPVVRASNRDIRLIMAAPSPSGGSAEPGTAIDDYAWLDAFIAADGLRYVDCIGVHLNGFNLPPEIAWNAGYNNPTAVFRGPFDNPHHSWSFTSTLTAYHEKTNRPLCVTEFGWASMEGLGASDAPGGFGFALDNSSAQQAEYILKAFLILRESGYVQFAILFNLDYVAKTSVAADQDSALPYSIIDKKGGTRPAFDAIERLVKN